MQFYDLKTVDEPTTTQADALREIRSRVTESLGNVDDAKAEKLEFKIAASSTIGPNRMIVDVDLGGETLPIDLGTWAFATANRDRAAACVVSRVREIVARRDDILHHLAGLRGKVEAVIAGKGGQVSMIGLHFWPIEGSERFKLDELRHELRVEQFGFDRDTMELRRLEESYHGYGVQELTDCIRQDAALQRRMAELRGLLDQAGVIAKFDSKSQGELADGKVPPDRIAERLIAEARHATA